MFANICFVKIYAIRKLRVIQSVEKYGCIFDRIFFSRIYLEHMNTIGRLRYDNVDNNRDY